MGDVPSTVMNTIFGTSASLEPASSLDEEEEEREWKCFFRDVKIDLYSLYCATDSGKSGSSGGKKAMKQMRE